MSLGGERVEAALDRWERTGLLEPALAERLRTDALEEAERSARLRSRYALAATGAVVLLVAVGVLGEWLWPRMGVGGRSVTLALLGLAVHAGGLHMEDRERLLPASYLLQTAGLLTLLVALLYSEARWADATPGGIVVGLVALVVPLFTIPRALGRNPVMPAVHLALGFAFLAVFLSRGTGLEADQIVWILDAVMVAVAGLLVWELSRVRDAEAAEWRLNAFVTALFGGLVLVLWTGLGPLDLEDGVLWAADVWLAVVTLLTLWGIHRAPRWLQRDGFERQLGACVVMAVPLAFYTTIELLDTGPEAAALAVGAIGGAAMAYGSSRDADAVLRAGSLAFAVAATYYGFARSGALGAVLALSFTAGLLFWLATRVRRGRDEA